MEEVFRFLVDLSGINLVERDTGDRKGFVRTDSYAMRLGPWCG